MGVIATAVEHLLAAGVTGAALVQAIADMEAATSGAPGKVDAAEKRREFDRERKRRKAAEKKALAEAAERNSTGNSTGNVVESAESERNSGGTQEVSPTLPLSPNDLFSNPQTPTHPDNIPTREAVPFEAHVAAWLEWHAAKPKAKGGKRSVRSETPDRPDDVSEQVWSDFLKHRRKHRADLTATALAGFRREADRVGWPLEQAIEESILRNWRGFKADWVKTNDRNGYGNSGFGAPAGSRFQPEGGIAEGLRRIELARNHGPSGEAGRWDDCEPEGGYLGSGS